jgi:hypothetical protein
VTSKINSRNRRNNKIVSVFGKPTVFAEAVDKYVIVSYSTALDRIGSGWEVEKALTTPLLRL